jgi:monothiol glutaredoxin
VSYTDQIKDLIENSDVALFMKGTPSFIMCGNSDRALQALRRAGAPVTTVDVLPDPQIRQDLSAISGWPTVPQVFVKGELVGGADIVEELEQSGELAATLRDKLGDDFAAKRDETTVALASCPAYRGCERLRFYPALL